MARRLRHHNRLIILLLLVAGLAVMVGFFCVAGDPGEMRREEYERARRQGDVCLLITLPIAFAAGGAAIVLDRRRTRERRRDLLPAPSPDRGHDR
jgi:hypothetical protein